ncbi:uroporphyrinogen decarboxylase [Kitasatospora paracochleata]|uniref:Uroporphyrinogen decarboxylase n=1 Tax=Kitasatospora paracochleata TaxID=58354 RepID=A0ABT1ISA2_9ACTN|nr:uroporphyrinogen decarboxylase [Kitasatospora paracochleata]
MSETSAATPAAQPGQQSSQVTARRGAAHDSVFLRAARFEPVPYTPVWFMRQAGRSLPEYLKVREGIPMLESCMRPELVKEITLQPVRRHGVDAAIFFSDIVVPLKAVGIDVDIKPGVGPVIADPIRSFDDLQRLRPLEPDDMPYIAEAVGLLVDELGTTPLIGFAGAPFTLASYLIEGGPSRTYENTKAMMYGEPELWAALVDRLAQITSAFLKIQIEAGASAIQLFDSWAGALAPDEYRRSVLPASSKVFDAVAPYGVPRIHFGVNTGELLGLMGQAGADIVGVDWRVPLHLAAERVGPGKGLQGNLDPAVLFAPTRVVETKAREVLHAAQAIGDSGHIFNLGHGVMPSMDPDALTRLVAFVHEASAR